MRYMINNYLSTDSLVPFNCQLLLLQPYTEGVNNISKAFSERIPLEPNANLQPSRVTQFLTGLALLIPIINTIALLVLRKYFSQYPPIPVIPLPPQPTPQEAISILPNPNHPIATAAPNLAVPGPLPAAPAPQISTIPSSEAAYSEDKIRESLIDFCYQLPERRIRKDNSKPVQLQHLSSCAGDNCHFTSRLRTIFEDRVYESTKNAPKDRILRYVSIGSGLLLTDWRIAVRMILNGLRSSFHFIDIGYTPAELSSCTGWKNAIHAFKTSLEIIAKTNIEVCHYSSVKEYEEKNSKENIDYLLAIDAYPEFIQGVRQLESRLLGAENDAATAIVDRYQKTFEYVASAEMNAELNAQISRKHVSLHYSYFFRLIPDPNESDDNLIFIQRSKLIRKTIIAHNGISKIAYTLLNRRLFKNRTEPSEVVFDIQHGEEPG